MAIKSIRDKIYKKAGIESQRTKNITKHVVLSFIYKGGSVIANFLLVPLTINYLDTENYGVWLTLSSFIAWFSFFDIGLGNGLRNKFAEAKAQGDLLRARAYVSSAYYTIGAVCAILIVLFVGLNFVIDWTKVFNTKPELYNDLKLLMPIVFGFFCLQLVAKLITTIYTADQHHSMQGKINFFTQAGSLILIWLMTFTNKSSLVMFGVIFSALPLMILIAFNLFAFSNSYKEFKPVLYLWKKEYLTDIFNLGIKFFFIQLAGIILFTTDNIIITQLYGPDQVVPFNIAFKYFSISNMIIAIVLTPYWSSITEAYAKHDFEWIKRSMKNLNKISLASILLLVFMILISSMVYRVWVGDKVIVPFSLTVFMAVFFGMTIFYAPFTYFINGTGKLSLQLYSLMATSIVNIPLSIFLAKNLNFQITGVIVATIVCLIPHVILSPIQYLKIINKKADGIWGK